MQRARVAIVSAVAVCALGGAGWLATGDTKTPPPALPPIDPNHPLTRAVAAGMHTRIDAPRGAVHVWIPPSYHADTGATVIYIHGYYDDADSAYIGHHLPEQFAMSALNAMFIVPEAPSGNHPPVAYPDLGELLRLVEERTGVPRGQALTVVVGHSGAFRTIDTWLDEPLVDQLVMIDAMYADDDAVGAWFKASPRHRLITVGEDTLQWNEALVRDLPDPMIIDRIPATYDQWPEGAHTARLVYIRAQYLHMPLITDGIVLPSLLRLLPVERLADEPWRYPLGQLPGAGSGAGSGTGSATGSGSAAGAGPG